MICSVCYRMLRGQEGRQWRGTFDLHFAHHPTKLSLAMSAEMGCCFCRVVAEEMALLPSSDRHPRDGGHLVTAFLCAVNTQANAFDRPNRSSAGTTSSTVDHIRRLTFMQVNDRSGSLVDYLRLYRLDFKLNDTRRLGSFLLRPADHAREGRMYTPSSKSTSDNEVLDLARYWIRRCNGHEHPKCRDWDRDGGTHHFLPTRLVELPQTRKGLLDALETVPDDSVKLVESADLPLNAHSSFLYVTLSHRWGEGRFTRLLKGNRKEFLKNIPLKILPKTFRDAIELATHLDRGRIRYIWIDSLCIIQDDAEDWLRESVQMYQIYANSYCNISATAAMDGSKGLFYPREPHNLLEDEINLNTNGLLQEQRLTKQTKLPRGYSPLIRRCSVFDLSFWARLVEDSPVNKRAWVLQERLLAPRVLHFCGDQIAWECSELDAAESFPDGLPTQELVSGSIQEKVRLKNLLAWQHTTQRQPRQRLNTHDISQEQQEQMIIDPEQTSEVVHNHWILVVERYSTTGLTRGSDKLIALAGLAELMSGRIRGRYVAGMWEKYLASQLLWRVRTSYENGRLLYPSRRPMEYRAPSFSWAAVDAPQGVQCSETRREKELFIKVENIHVLTRTKTPYGPLKKVVEGEDPSTVCHIRLTGPRVRVSVELYDYRGNPRYHCGFWGATDRYSQMAQSDDEAAAEGQGGRSVEVNGPTTNGTLAEPANEHNVTYDSKGRTAHDALETGTTFAEPENIGTGRNEHGEGATQEDQDQEERPAPKVVHWANQEKSTANDPMATRPARSERYRRKAKEAKPTIGVYLDCPEEDGEMLENKKAVVYCMPAYRKFGEDLTCLLLYQEPRREHQAELYYRRVGLVTIPGFLPADQDDYLEEAAKDVVTITLI